MAPAIPDALIAAYRMCDGEWRFQLMQVLGCWYVSPPAVGVVRSRRRKTKAMRSPLPPRPPPSCVLEDVLEALCSSMLVNRTLQVQSNLVIRCTSVPQLTSYAVQDGEQFGALAHWSRLLESTAFPNIVVYLSSEKQFFVVCANATFTQKVHTRSAICWLRERAGLGFCVDDEHGVFRIEVARTVPSDDEDQDRWSEGLALLSSRLSVVFPACTFSDES